VRAPPPPGSATNVDQQVLSDVTDQVHDDVHTGTAIAVIRLTADAILDLWGHDGTPTTGDRTAARNEILASGTQLVNWYERTAQAIAGSGTVADQIDHDYVADRRLIGAVRRDLNGQDGRATATAVKMIWTADHIDAIRSLQARILTPARVVAATQKIGRIRPPRRTAT